MRLAGSRTAREACETTRFRWEDGLVTDPQVRQLRKKRMAGKMAAKLPGTTGRDLTGRMDEPP